MFTQMHSHSADVKSRVSKRAYSIGILTVYMSKEDTGIGCAQNPVTDHD